MPYALIIGDSGGDRSAMARDVARRLAGRGLRVAGFTQRIREVTEGRKAIEVERLGGGAAIALARTSAAAGPGPAVCSYAFDAAAFEEVRRWVEADAAGAQVLVLDGLGKLELGGGGHRAALELALRAGPPVVLAVRRDQVFYALEALDLDAPLASCAGEDGAAALDQLVEAVALAARPPGP